MRWLASKCAACDSNIGSYDRSVRSMTAMQNFLCNRRPQGAISDRNVRPASNRNVCERVCVCIQDRIHCAIYDRR